VASFFRKKGHPYLLRSFARVREAHPEAALLLAGEGPERAAAEEQVRGLGLQGRALFAGYREDARALIRSADLLLPNVLLEAMAAGRPQVATRVGGVPEAMEDGVTGFLVPPRDPFLMAERIDCLLGDRSLKDRMAAASRERFRRRFTAARMAREHEELYEAVLGGSAS
jgi:glycosyltransferase involved in cell wall biosynthesis